jgi:hypothetical protein
LIRPTSGTATVLKLAGVSGVRMKDLRDTFASQLLTAGVQLGYVSLQLGHSTVAVTAQHYARWVGEDEYRDPVHLEPDELPADVLAKLAVPTIVPRVEVETDQEFTEVRETPGGRRGIRTPDPLGVNQML